MYSITEQQTSPVILTSFPRGYYVKAGFYMFFGWLWAGVVLWTCLAIAFFILIAIGVISGGFLHGLMGGLH
jgi:hypothetical protein